jgi:hypothetical protein
MTAVSPRIIRFPVERRAEPSLALVMQIAPDSREIDMIVEACGIELPPEDVMAAADLGMAERIAAEVPPEPGVRREAALADLLDTVIRAAIDKCAAAAAARRNAEASIAKTDAAAREGGYWMEELIRISSARALAAAELVLEAHLACQQALGAARAIRLARYNEDWVPFDLDAEAEALFFGPGAVTAADRTAP